jgi:hypothetical protein
MAKKLGLIAFVAAIGLLIGLARYAQLAYASDVTVEKSVTTGLVGTSTDSIRVYLYASTAAAASKDTSASIQMFGGGRSDMIEDEWTVVVEAKGTSKVAGAVGATGIAALSDSAKYSVKIQMSEDNSVWYPTTPTAAFSDSFALGKDTTAVRVNHLAPGTIPYNFRYIRFIVSGTDSGASAASLQPTSNDSVFIRRIGIIGRSQYNDILLNRSWTIDSLKLTGADTTVIQMYNNTAPLKQAIDSLRIVTMAKALSTGNSIGGTVKYQFSRDNSTWLPSVALTATTLSNVTVSTTTVHVTSDVIAREYVPATYRYIRLITTGDGDNDTTTVKHRLIGYTSYTRKR